MSKINLLYILAEWETSDGELVALAAKSYLGLDYASGTAKIGTKGIPHSVQIKMQYFRDILYQTSEDRHMVSLNSLRLNKDKIMCRTNCVKQGLTDIFIKLSVENDKISCTPLKINGEFI